MEHPEEDGGDQKALLGRLKSLPHVFPKRSVEEYLVPKIDDICYGQKDIRPNDSELTQIIFDIELMMARLEKRCAEVSERFQCAKEKSEADLHELLMEVLELERKAGRTVKYTKRRPLARMTFPDQEFDDHVISGLFSSTPKEGKATQNVAIKTKKTVQKTQKEESKKPIFEVTRSIPPIVRTSVLEDESKIFQLNKKEVKTSPKPDPRKSSGFIASRPQSSAVQAERPAEVVSTDQTQAPNSKSPFGFGSSIFSKNSPVPIRSVSESSAKPKNEAPKPAFPSNPFANPFAFVKPEVKSVSGIKPESAVGSAKQGIVWGGAIAGNAFSGIRDTTVTRKTASPVVSEAPKTQFGGNPDSAVSQAPVWANRNDMGLFGQKSTLKGSYEGADRKSGSRKVNVMQSMMASEPPVQDYEDGGRMELNLGEAPVSPIDES
jgi:hypothetical protein